MGCLDDNEVAALLEGAIEPARGAAAREHIESCASCRALVSGALPATQPRRPRPGETPAKVGRYSTIRPLGAGGMGVVYLAYDPELDRQVALKLLKPGTSKDQDEKARLLVEARALARLNHPNVIVVHDVGEGGGRVFIAMEYVDGSTLGEWARRPGRTADEVLQTYVLAGRGLAAAHAAGLVHRDFKPENVLIGADGRVRVTDFGLARLAAGLEPARSLPAGLQPAEAVTPSTAPGSLVGSPAYMSPEQLRGEQADARSDLFSFCVSLYEGLYGVRPFAGRNIAELADSIRKRKLTEPASPVRVRAAVRRELLRGLEPEPLRRQASMDELLAVLAIDPAQRRRRWLFGAASALAVASAIAYSRPAVRARILCAGREALPPGAWDQAVRASVRSAFLGTKKPFAAAASASVEGALDAYARGWAVQRRAACEAMVRSEESQELFDLRMACLDERAHELAARTSLFARADAEVVQRAPAAVASLPALLACADARRLRDRTRPPAPEQKEKVERLRLRLLALAALIQAAKYEQALAPLQALAGEAAQLGYRPLEAETQLQLGTLQAGAGRSKDALQAFSASAAAAAAGGSDAIAAQAWASSTQSQLLLGLLDDAERSISQGRGALERLGGDAMIESDLESALASLANNRDRYPEEEQHARRAVALIESRPGGTDQLRLAAALQALGVAWRNLRKFDEGRGAAQRALDVLVKELGPDHPDLAAPYRLLADLEHDQGHYQAASPLYQRALDITERALGPDSPAVSARLIDLAWSIHLQSNYAASRALFARALAVAEKTRPDSPLESDAVYGLGTAEMQLGEQAAARVHLERALALDTKSAGPRSRGVALIHSVLASLSYDTSDLAEARRHLDEALSIKKELLGARHPSTALTLRTIGILDLREGRPLPALAACEESLSIVREKLGGATSELAMTLGCVGRARAALGRLQAARDSFEEGLRVGAAAKTGDDNLGLVRFGLADVLWRTGGDRLRAIELAEQARAAWEPVAHAWSYQLPLVRSWLALHTRAAAIAH